MKVPKLSIIISTYNSARTIERTLASIERQTIAKNKREILIVDGGSVDATLSIAKKYHCKIIHNPLVEPLSAKHLGFVHARGRFVMGLDHDEVLVGGDSLEKRLAIFARDKRVKALHSSGYITPKNSNPINYYINEFGDPFSFFIYRLTKDVRFFLNTLRRRYAIVFEDNDYALFAASLSEKRAPLMEALSAAGMVDKAYCVKHFRKLIPDKRIFLPNIQLLMLTLNPYIAVLKTEPLYHYSSENLRKYMKKLEWRIKNNIYFGDASGAAGFLLREQYEGKHMGAKKFLFVPYSFSILLPLFDAIYLSITRDNWYYLIHLPLSLWTSILIIYHYLLKSLGVRTVLTSYDGASKILTRWK